MSSTIKDNEIEPENSYIDIKTNDHLTKIILNYHTDFYYYILIILVVYIILFIILRLIFTTNMTTKGLDIIFILFILFISLNLGYTYFYGINYSNIINLFIEFLDEPASIIIVFLFIIFLYLFIFFAEIPMSSDNKPILIFLFENISIFILVILMIIDFFKYIINVDFYMFNIIKPKNIETPVETSDNSLDEKPQVFNISNNLYTYDEADTICKAYGARLANYDDIEDSYNNGGEFSSYGWSQGQMAFFPTQKETWLKLQDNPLHKNDLGRPGINGGYFDNPNLKFGVNCFGKKPKPTKDDLTRIGYKPKKTPDELLEDEKLKFWIDNKDKLLVLNSFNTKKWSEF
jgi:hypothetical protein